MLKPLIPLFMALSLANWCHAQDDVVLIDSAAQQPLLTPLDRQFIVARLAQLDLSECQTRILRERPRIVYRQLSLPHRGQPLHISVAADVMRTLNMVSISRTARNGASSTTVGAIRCCRRLPSSPLRKSIPKLSARKKSAAM